MKVSEAYGMNVGRKYIPFNRSYGFAPLGRMSRWRVGIARAPGRRTGGSGHFSVPAKHRIANFLDRITPRSWREAGKVNRALERYSAHFGEVLGGLFPGPENEGFHMPATCPERPLLETCPASCSYRGSGNHSGDTHPAAGTVLWEGDVSFLKSLAKLRSMARPITGRGGNYRKLVEARMGEGLARVTREELAGLHESLNGEKMDRIRKILSGPGATDNREWLEEWGMAGYGSEFCEGLLDDILCLRSCVDRAVEEADRPEFLKNTWNDVLEKFHKAWEVELSGEHAPLIDDLRRCREAMKEFQDEAGIYGWDPSDLNRDWNIMAAVLREMAQAGKISYEKLNDGDLASLTGEILPFFGITDGEVLNPIRWETVLRQIRKNLYDALDDCLGAVRVSNVNGVLVAAEKVAAVSDTVRQVMSRTNMRGNASSRNFETENFIDWADSRLKDGSVTRENLADGFHRMNTMPLSYLPWAIKEIPDALRKGTLEGDFSEERVRTIADVVQGMRNVLRFHHQRRRMETSRITVQDADRYARYSSEMPDALNRFKAHFKAHPEPYEAFLKFWNLSEPEETGFDFNLLI